MTEKLPLGFKAAEVKLSLESAHLLATNVLAGANVQFAETKV